MIERPKAAFFKGQPLTLIGPEIKIGDRAPSFRLVTNDLSDLHSETLIGRPFILSVVPSLDTGVCAMQTRRFNQEARDIADDVTILTVSMDLPFAQKRFCDAEGIARVITASDYKYREFGPAYGVQIKELGLLSRSVFVIDETGRIVYAQYVKEITTEPDYAPAIEAIKQLV
jgi:thioredoxin-dependent peroxiredoxin